MTAMRPFARLLCLMLVVLTWLCMSDKYLLMPICLGSLVVSRALDYETVNEYIITVEAHDGGTPSLSSTCVVKVLVVDANDNRPTFTQSNYTAVVREDVAVKTSLLQVCFTSFVRSFVHCLRAGVQPTLEPSAGTFLNRSNVPAQREQGS